MESELGRVVDALPGLVWTARPDGQIDSINQRWTEFTGLAVDRSRGRGVRVTTGLGPRSTLPRRPRTLR